MAGDDGMSRVFFQCCIRIFFRVQSQICFSLLDILAMAFEAPVGQDRPDVKIIIDDIGNFRSCTPRATPEEIEEQKCNCYTAENKNNPVFSTQIHQAKVQN